MPAFVDRLLSAQRNLGHCLCVGLDPHLSHLPPPFRVASTPRTDSATIKQVEGFLDCALAALADTVPVLKPQCAFFEQLGPAGFALLARITQRARSQGFLVIMDAKRGDIGSTAAAYASTFLAPGAELESDALTVNPYLGMDSLEPFLAACEQHDKGLFVLCKTSNPGSGDFQDRLVEGEPLFLHVARLLSSQAPRLGSSVTAWSGLGLVVGATHSQHAESIRRACPSGLFLVPGLGAQGAAPEDCVRGFVPSAQGLEGGIVSASRSVLFPPAAAQAQREEEVYDAIKASAQQTARAMAAACRET